jgi:hypothetical protein
MVPVLPMYLSCLFCQVMCNLVLSSDTKFILFLCFIFVYYFNIQFSPPCNIDVMVITISNFSAVSGCLIAIGTRCAMGNHISRLLIKFRLQLEGVQHNTQHCVLNFG